MQYITSPRKRSWAVTSSAHDQKRVLVACVVIQRPHPKREKRSITGGESCTRVWVNSSTNKTMIPTRLTECSRHNPNEQQGETTLKFACSRCFWCSWSHMPCFWITHNRNSSLSLRFLVNCTGFVASLEFRYQHHPQCCRKTPIKIKLRTSYIEDNRCTHCHN